MNARRSRRRWFVTVSVLLLAIATVAVVKQLSRTAAPPAGCQVSAGSRVYSLDLAQAANAATISSAAIRLGLSDHAVPVALATAMQESKLRNLDYGDRDSVGLFQQRPSQGWGLRARILDPHYAARAFFARLVKVPNWQTLSVAAAAQAVQRSAAGSAYADWEAAARALARAFTGEVPHGIACQFRSPAVSSTDLAAALRLDVGSGATGFP